MVPWTQGAAFGPDDAIALGIEDEGVAGQLAVGLALAVEHRDVGFDAAVDQPTEDGARATGAVGRQALGPPADAVVAALHHDPGGDDLLAEARGRRLDVHDHSVRGIDQIVGLIAEASRAALYRPRHGRVGRRQVLGRAMLRLIGRSRLGRIERFESRRSVRYRR